MNLPGADEGQRFAFFVRAPVRVSTFNFCTYLSLYRRGLRWDQQVVKLTFPHLKNLNNIGSKYHSYLNNIQWLLNDQSTCSVLFTSKKYCIRKDTKCKTGASNKLSKLWV